MPQGQYSLADAKPIGQFSLSDIGADPLAEQRAAGDAAAKKEQDRLEAASHFGSKYIGGILNTINPIAIGKSLWEGDKAAQAKRTADEAALDRGENPYKANRQPFTVEGAKEGASNAWAQLNDPETAGQITGMLATGLIAPRVLPKVPGAMASTGEAITRGGENLKGYETALSGVGGTVGALAGPGGAASGSAFGAGLPKGMSVTGRLITKAGQAMMTPAEIATRQAAADQAVLDTAIDKAGLRRAPEGTPPPQRAGGGRPVKTPMSLEELQARQAAADAARAADAAANPPPVRPPTPRPPIPQAQFNEMPLASQMAHLPEETGGGVLKTRTPITPIIPQEQTPFSQQPLAAQMDRLPQTPAPELTRGVEPPIQNLGNEAPIPTPFNERPLQEQMAQLPTTGGEASSRVPTPPIIPQPEPPTPFHELPLQQQMDQLPQTGGVPSERVASPPPLPQTPFNELPLYRQMEQLPTTGEAPELPRVPDPRAQNLGQETGPTSLLGQPGVLRTRPTPVEPPVSVGDKPPVSPTPDVGTSQAPVGPDLSSILSDLPQSSGLAGEPNIGLDRGTGEVYKAQRAAPDAPANPHGATPEEIRELRQMAAENESLPGGKHTFVEQNRRGGTMEIVPGSGGAESLQDIKDAGGYGARYREIRGALENVIDGTGKPSVNTKAVLETARNRLAGGGRPPGLPPDAGDYYETPLERTAREARGELPPTLRNAQPQGQSMRDMLIEQIRAHAKETGVPIDEEALQQELNDKDRFLGGIVEKVRQGGGDESFEFGDTPVDKTAAGDQPRLPDAQVAGQGGGSTTVARASQQASDDTFSLDDRTNAQKALDEERAAEAAKGPGLFGEGAEPTQAELDARQQRRNEVGSAQEAREAGTSRANSLSNTKTREGDAPATISEMKPNIPAARIQKSLQARIDAGQTDDELRDWLEHRADGTPHDAKSLRANKEMANTVMRMLGRKELYGIAGAAAGGTALRSALVNQLNQDGKQE